MITIEVENGAHAWTQAVQAQVARAVTVGVAAGAEAAKVTLRNQVLGAFASKRFVNAIGSAVYPRGRPSASAAGLVFGRGKRADMILAAHESGAAILPRKGRYLAIPLHNYRGADGTRLTPRQWFGARLQAIPLGRDARRIVLATKMEAGAWTKRGALKSRIRRITDTKSRKRLVEALRGRYIPQFLLVRAVKLRKVLHLSPAMAAGETALAAAFQRELSGRAADDLTAD